MAFERLQSLGTSKWTKILNTLMRGGTAMGLARVIQQEWKEFPDMSERTLTQQLNRLRTVAATGVFGQEIANEIQKQGTPLVKRLEGISSNAIERMEELSTWQRKRVMRFIEREEKLLLPPQHETGKITMIVPVTSNMVQSLNMVMNDYSRLLQDIQKMRFELGLDEYKGVLPSMRGASVSTTSPDGTIVQKQVFEAVTTIEHIFNQRGIPQAPDA